ncbi:cytochrome P450 [Aspergillus brunneoviolaceus CBS 621.78]|uniref:Benzoate 4-monooxygenase cytochrome P450 n=1 Tax=Aspergillus brunneoviolaceus CBS 621.78 TaxID=1450534 RepID=A0ACD1GL34_9EURO|nr:benzoate 4-monooxygenase cytochrome P450 [Aspergillus brunneoviolaceus CBS 621.78]RAH49962.1 benzoate 4-monooxygenase cytochrome P450 [Aspergillus brunneoviolaceus CBS 621.78]
MGASKLFTPLHLLLIFGGTFLAYILCTLVHRLALGPLARFPGPKLAAATRWYEFYFDVVKEGQFMFEIERMHERYGPVVRISAFELHIKDPDFYNTLYSGPLHKREKYSWFVSAQAPGTTFAASGHGHHRARRGILASFFSKQSIRAFEPDIIRRIDSVCWHLENAMKRGKAIELHNLFINFAVDTVSLFAFGPRYCFNTLDYPVLTDMWKKGVNSIFETLILLRHLPFLYTVSRYFPAWICCLIQAQYRNIKPVEEAIEERMTELFNSRKAQVWDKSIFASILQDDGKHPSTETTLPRLIDEAKFLLVAGTDAPSQVMAITLFHVLRNPRVHARLKDELTQALPRAAMTPSWQEMEKLPYLSAVIKEGLRLSAVVTSRLPRIAPDETLYCNGWEIPPGTPVSMSTHFILRNPAIVPRPMEFWPERWEANPQLERYLVPFSKGSQACLGPSMAYCWLNLVLATVLRRFRLELFDTSENNVATVRDCFNGQTAPGQNCIQVKVLGCQAPTNTLTSDQVG